MYFKNISTTTLTLGSLGVVLAPNEVRSFAECGNEEAINNAAPLLNDLVYTNKLQVINDTNTVLSKAESVASITSPYNLVSLLSPKGNDRYYFLKDNFQIPKNVTITKYFRGTVSSLFVTPNSNNVDIVIISGDGLRLPTDELIKRQTLEFSFEDRIRDIEVQLTARDSNVEVDVFLEGHSDVDTVETLQNFINTWYQDANTWNTTASVLVKSSIKNSSWTGVHTVDSVNGNRLVIPASKIVTAGSREFEVYIDNVSIIVEYLEWDSYSPKNPDKLKVIYKNIRYIQFSDVTIDLTTYTPIDWADRKEDGRHY